MGELPRIGHAWIDESRAPLYAWSFPRAFTDGELVASCDARERWASVAKFRVSWLVDLTNLTGASATQRRIFAEHLGRFEPHDVAWNQGSAIVVRNALVRGMVTAVFWMKPPRFPHQVFAHREEAIAWGRARLAG